MQTQEEVLLNSPYFIDDGERLKILQIINEEEKIFINAKQQEITNTSPQLTIKKNNLTKIKEKIDEMANELNI